MVQDGMLPALVLLCVAALCLRLARPKYKYPPGPRPLPFIGNLLDIPRHEDDHPRVYAEWGKVYGPISHIHVLGRDFIMLNTAQAAFDLLEKRSSIYSSRPRLVMAGELVGRDKSTLFLPYGERLRTTRKLLHSFLRADVASQHWPIQQKETLKLLQRLRESPAKFDAHIHSCYVAMIMKQVYGYEARYNNDPYVALAQALSKITTDAYEPGRWLVDSFPWMRHIPSWMPMAHFKRWAAKAREDSVRFTRAPFDMAIKSMEKGVDHSFVSSVFKPNSTPEEEEIAMYAAASLYNGASDTIASVMHSFFLIMATHPHVQARAQQEIDTVIGPGRIPSMEDLDSMEYITCLIKELLRFSPLIPIVPHSPIEDDEYEGYYIPKGSWVMANLWGMLHDAEVFPDPHKFQPERFESSNPERQPDPTRLALGLGRRRCPGYHFAVASVFLSITNVLWAFDILPPKDENGQRVPPPVEYISGHSVHPKPFACDIVPRTLAKFDLIEQTLVEQE